MSRPFPWFGRAPWRQRATTAPTWLDGERVETEEPMPEVKIQGAHCIRCGLPEEPTASGHGLVWRIEVCEPCTKRMAARWLLRTAPRLLRDKLET